MKNIHASSYVMSDELTPDNLCSSFEKYALKLEKMAGSYRKLVDFIKTKNIKILEAGGFCHRGTFIVDDIDTGRLKQEGFVVDYSDENPALHEEPVFCIDPELDSVLEDAAQKLNQIIGEEENYIDSLLNINEYSDEYTEVEETIIFDQADVDDEESLLEIIEINIDDEPFLEKTSFFNLSEVLEIPDTEIDGLRPGDISTEVKKIDDHRFTFNLVVADLHDDIYVIDFIRDRCIFKYKCGSCDDVHTESLDSVYRSLKIANALLSNLTHLTEHKKELCTALDFIDHDLRLLQSLLKSDYAIEDIGD